jgi:hypothetical protein
MSDFVVLPVKRAARITKLLNMVADLVNSKPAVRKPAVRKARKPRAKSSVTAAANSVLVK